MTEEAPVDAKKPMFTALDMYESEQDAVRFCWICMQTRPSFTFEDDICYLCNHPPEERVGLTVEQVVEYRKASYRVAIETLIRNHRAEFLSLVSKEQRNLGISDEIVKF